MDIESETNIEYKVFSVFVAIVVIILIFLFVSLSTSAQKIQLSVESHSAENGILTFTVKNEEQEDFVVTTLQIGGKQCYTCGGENIIPKGETQTFSCLIDKVPSYDHTISFGSQNIDGQLQQESLINLQGSQTIKPLVDVELVPKIQKTISTPVKKHVIGVTVDSCENAIITSNILGNANSNIQLTYLTAQGDIITEKEIETQTFDSGVNTIRNTDGSFITIGTSYVLNQGNDGIILKHSNLFKTIWRKRFGTSQEDLIKQIAVDPQGNIYTATFSDTQTIQKRDSTLFNLWNKEIQATDILELHVDESSVLILTEENDNTRLVELDANGEKITERVFDVEYHTTAIHNNTIYLGGHNDEGIAFLHKLGGWTQEWSKDSTQEINDLTLGPDHIYALVELKNKQSTHIRHAILKYSFSGELVQTYYFPTQEPIRIKTIELTTQGLLAIGDITNALGEKAPYLELLK